MPMPQTYCPCPRPILKRPNPALSEGPTSPRDESSQLLSIDPSILSSLVHFPPHSAMARTFAAYSPSTYDRSPITVLPNSCKLPERGCPGRTYFPAEPTTPAGKCLHPRAAAATRAVPPVQRPSTPFAAYRDQLEDDEENDVTPMTTPTLYSRSLPALIPDVSSSESSEESDTSVSYAMDASLSEFGSMFISANSKPTSFLPHPGPSSPRSHRATSPSSRTRHRIPTSTQRTTSRVTSPSPRSRRSRTSISTTSSSPIESPVSPVEPSYKLLSETSFLSDSLSIPDVGCFGGF
ncbi:hypothetical protein ABKN59_006176 [Abortiporus biennis]